ncbi:MAG TPA: glycosyltransferase family 9 protein [Ignavibacteria bacterium]|nr:glycosyltransferase family 9 protein [Ignavibacteria bacterium]
MSIPNLKSDCIYFPGDRPCEPHKKTGIICDDCNLYKSVKNKILIIKLDAIGDVLRTTSILPSLHSKYPDAYISWLTKDNAKDLFKHNHLVNEILIYENPFTNYYLKSVKFELVINLDPSPVSSAIASAANSNNKIGFGLNELGKVKPFNEQADEWFKMGAFDILKKQNTKTYQKIIHEICSLEYTQSNIIINLSESEIDFAKRFYEMNDLKQYDFLIGINPGASDRWEFKKWRKEGYVELFEKINSEYNCGILLFGGLDEKELLLELSSVNKNIINTGFDNSLRQFISLMSLPDIFITGDTLALHIATALKKEILCLFGPTSYNEIEDYGIIDKIYPDMECLVCYKMRCDFKPNCMEAISSEMVFSKLKNKINKINK